MEEVSTDNAFAQALIRAIKRRRDLKPPPPAVPCGRLPCAHAQCDDLMALERIRLRSGGPTLLG